MPDDTLTYPAPNGHLLVSALQRHRERTVLQVSTGSTSDVRELTGSEVRFGQPHEKFGEAVTALVVPRAGVPLDEATLGEIQALVEERMGSVHAPSRCRRGPGRRPGRSPPAPGP